MDAVKPRKQRCGFGDAVRTLVLVLALALFLVPLISSAVFGFILPGKGFTLSALTDALAGSEFLPQLLTSFMLMVTSTALLLVILVPTLVWLHLRGGPLLMIAETLSLMPLVIPAIALVNGVTLAFGPVAPGFIADVSSLIPFYAILAMPLAYRALAAGLRAIDLRVLYDAASSIGARPWRIIGRILLPNLWPAVMVAALLSFVMVLGEFVLAKLLLHDTFPTFVVTVGQNSPRAAAGLSFIVLIGTWLMMTIISALAGRRSRGAVDLI